MTRSSFPLAMLAVVAGCSSEAAPSRATQDGALYDPHGAGNSPSDPPPSNVTATSMATGVVAIDVQSSFVTTASRRNPSANTMGRVANDKQVFQLARTKSLPFFITYEASMSGDHALHPSLRGDLPPGQKSFIKTTFAATGQPQFLAAIKASGLRRFLVIGAETDVCVLQTILGLRREGFDVVAQLDAIFTEEVNIGPAVRRMQQAGVGVIGSNEVENVLGGQALAHPPSALDKPPVIVKSLEIGVLLSGLEGLGASDVNASAKRARLRELFLVTEWFKLPVYAENPASALAALPSDLRSLLTRPIQPLASRPSAITQLAIAGSHTKVLEDAATLQGAGVEVFLVEDALLGGGSAHLEPAYVAGAIPSTYKTLYYELTKSVSDAEWPSQQWVRDGDRYFDMTQAPEDLPPLVPN